MASDISQCLSQFGHFRFYRTWLVYSSVVFLQGCSIAISIAFHSHTVSNNFRLFSPTRSLFPVYPFRKPTGLISYPYLLGEYWGTCLFVAWWRGLEAGAETGSASFPGIRFPTPSLAWIYSFGTWNPGQPGGCVLEAAAAPVSFITAGFW